MRNCYFPDARLFEAPESLEPPASVVHFSPRDRLVPAPELTPSCIPNLDFQHSRANHQPEHAEKATACGSHWTGRWTNLIVAMCYQGELHVALAAGEDGADRELRIVSISIS